jgi:hypothetical protein
MSRILLFLTALTLAASFSPDAYARHRGRYYAPYLAQPLNPNTFGPGRSGVAPSTAIPERRSVYVTPASQGARTGGVND